VILAEVGWEVICNIRLIEISLERGVKSIEKLVKSHDGALDG